MTTYEQLLASAESWREVRREYRRRSSMFLVDFANAFREYIGAPEQYMDRIARRALSYVQPVKAIADEDGVYSFEAANTLDELLVRDDKDRWIVGLQLAINKDPGALRAMYFWYLIKFALVENVCEMTIGFKDQSFSFGIEDEVKRQAAFDYMISLVQDVLALKPWESAQKPIGFLQFKQS